MRHLLDASAGASPAPRPTSVRVGWAVRALAVLGFLAQAPAQDTQGLPADFPELRVGLVAPSSPAAEPRPEPLRAPSRFLAGRACREPVFPAAPETPATPWRTWSPSPEASAAGLAVRVARDVTVALAGGREMRPSGDDRMVSATLFVRGF